MQPYFITRYTTTCIVHCKTLTRLRAQARGNSTLARLAGLHPLRISPYARAAGSRDTKQFSVTHQYNTYLSTLSVTCNVYSTQVLPS